MAIKNKGEDKLYFSIGEVAGILNVSTSLLRHWESEFPSIRPKKNNFGVRHYAKKDIELIKYIYHLVKVDGLTLDGAKKIIRQKDNEQVARYETLKSLEKIRNFMVALRNEIE